MHFADDEESSEEIKQLQKEKTEMIEEILQEVDKIEDQPSGDEDSSSLDDEDLDEDESDECVTPVNRKGKRSKKKSQALSNPLEQLDEEYSGQQDMMFGQGT